MKRFGYGIIVALMLVLLVGFAMKSCGRGKPPSTTKTDLNSTLTGAKAPERGKAVVNWQPSPDERDRWQSTTAVLHGKVVDLEGRPVPGALIVCDPNPDPWKPSLKRREIVAQADGTFVFKEPNAPTVLFSASASGYYTTEKSHAVHMFAKPLESMPSTLKSKVIPPSDTDSANPALFVLRKMGDTHPLIHRSYAGVMLPSKSYLIGTAVTHNIRITYTFDPVVKRIHKIRKWPIHDWGIEIAVDGGGIQRCQTPRSELPLSFVAPEEGYTHSIKIVHSSTKPDDAYAPEIDGEFFIRFADKTFARIRVSLSSSAKDPFASLESWFVPSGERSTEFDPTKEIIQQ